MKFTYRKFSLFLIITLILLICFYSKSYKIPDSTFKVHYIDVGQGDSSLIQSNGKNLLIDAGTLESSDDLVKYLKSLNIEKLDFLIATHPHEDHIGGVQSIVKKFDVDYFFMPKIIENTDIFKDMINLLKEKNININPIENLEALPIDLGKNTKIDIFSPYYKTYENLNNYSPIFKVYYGETSFLFTGDAESDAENEAIKSNKDLKSDVLKVGHHGSKTSSTDTFLKEVYPKISIISSGLDNPYNHPSKETLEKLSSYKTKIFRTDEDGTIILTSDGKTIKEYKN